MNAGKVAVMFRVPSEVGATAADLVGEFTECKLVAMRRWRSAPPTLCPTDVMPMTRWAMLTMLTMLTQSVVSVITVVLVIARVVNILRP